MLLPNYVHLSIKLNSYFAIRVHCINYCLPLIAFVTSDGTLYASAAAAAAAVAAAAGPGSGGKKLH